MIRTTLLLKRRVPTAVCREGISLQPPRALRGVSSQGRPLRTPLLMCRPASREPTLVVSASDRAYVKIARIPRIHSGKRNIDPSDAITSKTPLDKLRRQHHAAGPAL